MYLNQIRFLCLAAKRLLTNIQGKFMGQNVSQIANMNWLTGVKVDAK
jgi:hypothetical protein